MPDEAAVERHEPVDEPREGRPVVQLQPDDRVLMYTDGVVEGRDQGGQEFGVERLIDRLEREVHDSLASEEILRRLTQSVLAWQGGSLRDDSTLLLLHWSPEGLALPQPQPGPVD